MILIWIIVSEIMADLCRRVQSCSFFDRSKLRYQLETLGLKNDWFHESNEACNQMRL
jgi:hypothetical protein